MVKHQCRSLFSVKLKALNLKVPLNYSLNDIFWGICPVLGAIILRNLTRNILESIKAAYDINIENPSEISIFFLKKNIFLVHITMCSVHKQDLLTVSLSFNWIVRGLLWFNKTVSLLIKEDKLIVKKKFTNAVI